jgi:PD-(D/E)XK nuclease superfamily
MITEGDLDVIFGGLETRLEGAAEYRAKAARLIGSEFTAFRFIDYERRFSDILADLLNPAGSHGQGHTFLLNFLNLIEKRALSSIGVIPLMREALASRRIHVRREQPTSNGRFIDILVSAGNLGFGIENKPWAKDQGKQLYDYANHLSRCFETRWALFYLSGSGNLPATHSLTSDERQKLLHSGNYLELTYAGDLAEWLSTCVHACDADKVRWFLRDFRDFAMTKFKFVEQGRENADG